jgi:hypothetical protein
MSPEHYCYTNISVDHNIKLELKPSWVNSHVNVELRTNGSEISSDSAIRVNVNVGPDDGDRDL